ncbi:hypothetical protein XcodCFBP4690_01230 [Xanthomonas codiaei]|uniref:Uncharacterized protein n=1 Tax=Xanthomonas codiaei TaxID=56463 RepID=A0A2S7CYX1_9XANT|nr:hypothetical protein XcodCFBP4690_01230 [Xanthomonas codiaei]
MRRSILAHALLRGGDGTAREMESIVDARRRRQSFHRAHAGPSRPTHATDVRRAGRVPPPWNPVEDAGKREPISGSTGHGEASIAARGSDCPLDHAPARTSRAPCLQKNGRSESGHRYCGWQAGISGRRLRAVRRSRPATADR